METALYYTFSTISQTLAGAIALLGAFVLFRLQTLAAAIEDMSLTTVNAYAPSADRDAVTRLHNAGQFAEVAAFARTHAFTDASANSPYVSSRLEQLQPLVDRSRAIRLQFNLALLLTVGLIAASVIVLALTPKIARFRSLPATSLTLGCAWLVVCLISYAKLVRETVSSRAT